MPNPIFENMLSHYQIATKDERTNAIHEVTQQITLAGLYKVGFSTTRLFTAVLSRRDSILLTVGFILRTKRNTTTKVPQGWHL